MADVGSRAHSEPRILLVASSGGHLAQLMELREWWGGHERAWCTFDTPDARGHLEHEETVHWAYSPTTRHLGNLARNTLLARRVVAEFEPTIIISTGAGVALPFFALGKAAGARTVYLEVFDRIDSATLTGRLCQPLTDFMCVQWEEQLSLYKNAHLIGPVL